MAAKEHSKLESKFEAEFKLWVEKQGGLALKMPAIFYSGIPDRIVLHEGVAYFVELKRDGQTPRKLQELWLRRLKRLGFCAIWLDYTAFNAHIKEYSINKLKEYEEKQDSF